MKLSTASTNDDLVSLLLSAPKEAPMPEIYSEENNGVKEYCVEWYFGNNTYVMVNFGGNFGDGFIYSRTQNGIKNEEFSMKTLYDTLDNEIKRLPV